MMTLLKTMLAVALTLGTLAGFAAQASVETNAPNPPCFPCDVR
jgi:hypothetical protein